MVAIVVIGVVCYCTVSADADAVKTRRSSQTTIQTMRDPAIRRAIGFSWPFVAWRGASASPQRRIRRCVLACGEPAVGSIGGYNAQKDRT